MESPEEAPPGPARRAHGAFTAAGQPDLQRWLLNLDQAYWKY